MSLNKFLHFPLWRPFLNTPQPLTYFLPPAPDQEWEKGAGAPSGISHPSPPLSFLTRLTLRRFPSYSWVKWSRTHPQRISNLRQSSNLCELKPFSFHFTPAEAAMQPMIPLRAFVRVNKWKTEGLTKCGIKKKKMTVCSKESFLQPPILSLLDPHPSSLTGFHQSSDKDHCTPSLLLPKDETKEMTNTR